MLHEISAKKVNPCAQCVQNVAYNWQMLVHYKHIKAHVNARCIGSARASGPGHVKGSLNALD